MYKQNKGCNKYADRSINEIYSKLLCQFSNTDDIYGRNGRKKRTKQRFVLF